MGQLSFILTNALIILIALLTIGIILARLYKRSSKEVSFVRTGFRGQKVILNGGAIVLPVLHEIIPVNMNTLRLGSGQSAGHGYPGSGAGNHRSGDGKSGTGQSRRAG